MNSNNCERMRLMIEESIGRPQSAAEEEELERHIAACPACREYREALLGDDSLLDEFVSCHSESAKRVEEKAAWAQPAGIPPAAPRRLGFSGTLARMPRGWRIVSAVAAAIALIAAFDFIRGAYYGPIPAFAAVVEKAQKAENVTYRLRLWVLGEWRTRTYVATSTGGSRIDFGDSIFVRGANPMRGLALYPSRKQFVAWGDSLDIPEFNSLLSEDPVQRLATWHKKWNFTFVRRKRYEGRSVAIYEGSPPRVSNVKTSTWVDLKTGLPVRIEMTNSIHRYTADSSLYGLRLADFLPPGSLRSKNIGWIDFREGEPCIIYDHFTWNAPIDTSLLSAVPPAGYVARRVHEKHYGDIDDLIRREGIPSEAGSIKAGLVEWVNLFGTAFPNDPSEMADVEKMRPALIKRYNGNGIPGDEYRAAIHAAVRLKDVSMYTTSQWSTRNHYTGKGCVFGDSTKVIWWMEQSKWHPYWILYADFHMVPSEAPPKE